MTKLARLLLVASIALSIGIGALYFFTARRGAGTRTPGEPASKAASEIQF